MTERRFAPPGYVIYVTYAVLKTVLKVPNHRQRPCARRRWLRVVALRLRREYSMPEYRVFTMNGNRIAGPADIIECETDQEAIEKARQMIDKTLAS